jgi:hypothetical protein
MAERAHRLGEPLVRPLYHLDPRAEALASPNSFAFGSELLVAPITSPVEHRTTLAQVSTWLPEGTWTDFFTGVRYTGGRFVQLHRPVTGYPVLAKAGGIVPLTWPDDYGTGNPDAIELHVFAGGPGDFTLYEDDDAAQPREVTTRYTADSSEVRIEAAAGALDLVPVTRRYRLVLHGLDAVTATLPDGTLVEAAAGPLVAEFDVPTERGAVVTLGGDRRVGDNRVESRIHDLLNDAQIEYGTKESIWRVMAEVGAPRRVASLQSMDLAPELYAALCELLLADA